MSQKGRKNINLIQKSIIQIVKQIEDERYLRRIYISLKDYLREKRAE